MRPRFHFTCLFVVAASLWGAPAALALVASPPTVGPTMPSDIDPKLPRGLDEFVDKVTEQAVGQQVGGDAVEPRPRVCPRKVVRGATREGHDERLGCEIFGQLSANTTPHKAEDRSKVTIEDERERPSVVER